MGPSVPSPSSPIKSSVPRLGVTREAQSAYIRVRFIATDIISDLHLRTKKFENRGGKTDALEI